MDKSYIPLYYSQGQKTCRTDASLTCVEARTDRAVVDRGGRGEMMPSTMRALAGMGSQYFGSAEQHKH